MLFGSLLIVFAVGLSTTLILIPIVGRISVRKGWTDAPDNRRKIHSAPIPNSGGLAIVGGWSAGIGAFMILQELVPSVGSVARLLPSPIVLLGALVIAGVGFLDDLYDLHFRHKLLAQLGVTAFVFAGGVHVGLFDAALGGGFLAMAVSFSLTAMWMVGTMNAVNFLDGMDGLASGVVAIILASLAGVYLIGGKMVDLVLCVALIGSLVGFLRYNFYPARIFMGDSGSLFLGYLLAVYALHGKAHEIPVIALVIPVVAMGLPILDTGTSIIRRLVDGKSLFYADRDHIHHRLSDRLSHRTTVLVLYCVGLFFGAGALIMAAVPPGIAIIVFITGTAIVAAFLYSLGYLRRSKEESSILHSSQSGDGTVVDHALPSVAFARGSDVKTNGRIRGHSRGVAIDTRHTERRKR